MISDKTLEAFDKLNINDKRNQISNELLIICELIKKFENVKGINPMINVKNYDGNSDNRLSEDEMLTFFYEDIYNIEQELITLLNLFN